MMKAPFLFFTIFILLLHWPKSEAAKPSLEKRIKERESERQHQRDQQWVLQSALSREKPAFEESWKKMNDKELFTELIRLQQRQKLLTARGLMVHFRQSFENSVFLDDAIYILGTMELRQNNFGQAIELFNEIIKEHPLSQKVPSSLYAKGVAFKKMNLPEFAKINFENVKKQFSGSPEALKAVAELQLIR